MALSQDPCSTSIVLDEANRNVRYSADKIVSTDTVTNIPVEAWFKISGPAGSMIPNRVSSCYRNWI